MIIILLAYEGLRLIDVGISELFSQVGTNIFDRYIETDLEELGKFRIYFLNR